MPWHPPVPFGAFYSKEALQLGPALSLLGYCYDKVQKESGGWFRLNLHTAAGDMEVPYPTVKRWWESLRKTAYIADYIERGRSGMDVLMSGDWLDWWREETRSRMISNGRETGQKRDRNGTEIASEVIPNTNAYKVPNNTDQAERGEDQDRTAHSLSHPAVLAYRTAFPHIRLNRKQEAIITALVGEGVERLECWLEVIQDYELSPNWKPENIGNMRGRFDDKLKEREAKKGNGRTERAPPVATQTWKPPDDALSGAALQEAIAARTKK